MSAQEEFEKRLGSWNRSAINYIIIGVVLLATSVVSSALITVFTGTKLLDNEGIKILSFISAVTTALQLKFNPLDIGFRFRDSWRLLDSALLRHATDPVGFPVNKVIDAVDKGEGLIGSASLTGSKPTK